MPGDCTAAVFFRKERAAGMTPGAEETNHAEEAGGPWRCRSWMRELSVVNILNGKASSLTVLRGSLKRVTNTRAVSENYLTALDRPPPPA
jgi:hypothetical protein